MRAAPAPVAAPALADAEACFLAPFVAFFFGELRVETRPEVAPHAAKRPIAASRLRGSGSSDWAVFFPPPFADPAPPDPAPPDPAASEPADAATASAGWSPACSIHRATDAATSGAGARRRRTPLGRARIASVSRSSRMPGTSQSVPASLTRSSTSIGMCIDTPSRGLPGANS